MTLHKKKKKKKSAQGIERKNIRGIYKWVVARGGVIFIFRVAAG